MSDLSDEAIFVFRDQWYPGWSVTVNGEEATLLRADLVFKAVKLPPGRSEVIFSYHPGMLGVGWILTILSLLVVIALPFSAKLIRRIKINVSD